MDIYKATKVYSDSSHHYQAVITEDYYNYLYQRNKPYSINAGGYYIEIPLSDFKKTDI